MALNFPAKIYQILENESNDIIRWHDNGIAFRIVDHGRFEREIIPKYFRHNQISSVQRQLNLYGFKCISRGEDKGAFFHPSFRRGDWETVRKITRYVPVRKSSTSDGPAEKKPDEDYVFNLGHYQSTSAVRRQDDDMYSAAHPGFFSDADSFALFPPSALAMPETADPVWQSYAPSTIAQNIYNPSQLARSRPHPQVVIGSQPSALTSRLGYKFPSVAQFTGTASATTNKFRGTCSVAPARPREYILYTARGTVQIDPDFDLGDCLHTTVDYDIGRHSVHTPSLPLTLPHGLPQQPQFVSHSVGSVQAASVPVAFNSGDARHYIPHPNHCSSAAIDHIGVCTLEEERALRSDSMDDFAELCADLAE